MKAKSMWVLGMAATVLLVPANSASARRDGWEPLTYPPIVEGACGSTAVHVTFPDVKEFQRFIPQPDGTVIQQITGTDRTRFTADTGADVTLDVSGPGRNILYPNGDVEIVSTGRYANALSPEQATQLGTPQIFASSGLIDYVAHPDGAMTPITIPHNVTNVCALLGAG